MRLSHSIAFAGLASATLSSCSQEDWAKFWNSFGSLPVVCPSSVYLDPSLLPQGSIRFRPYVQNKGVDDNTVPFTVTMKVMRSGATAPVLTIPYIPNGKTIPGTHAVSGVKAGPEVELTSASSVASWNTRYDPQATYSVTLDFKSTNDGLNLASDTCKHLGPVNFKGGNPV
jgi:hypothetical protein